jgi:hypothetical protein
MKMAVFWDVAAYRLVSVYHSFRDRPDDGVSTDL